MRSLGLALFAEGPTDHRFLGPLLRRVCEDSCARRAQVPVELGDVIELHSPHGFREAPREVRILEAARDSLGAWDILFIHTDGASNPERARAERVAPGANRIEQDLGDAAGRPVGVVPIRKTEAWALVDGDALRKAFGTTLSNEELGVPPRARSVQRIQDPKRALESAYDAVQSRGHRRGSSAGYLEIIGELVSLERVGFVPAFQEMEKDLTEALMLLQYIEG